MAEITLTNGLITQVDDEDFYWLNQWRWQTFTDKRGIHYAFRSRRNNHLGLSSRAYIHRIIMRIEDPNIFVDHINGDRLDNRKSNLRLCKNVENCRNKKGSDKGTSVYKGVSYDTNRNKWVSQIRIDDMKRLSKRFNTELDAALWYDEKAKEYHKEFAYINIINN